jgi:uncharacterized protein YjbJ (UPF0337 family)
MRPKSRRMHAGFHSGTIAGRTLFDLGNRFVWSLVMDKERIAGGVKKATGNIKEAAGKATGNRQLEAEGRADKSEGRVRSAIGHAKDAVRELVGGKGKR